MINIFFRYIHCLDTIEQYIEDFDTLQEYLKNNKKLKLLEIKEIIKYRSYH